MARQKGKRAPAPGTGGSGSGGDLSRAERIVVDEVMAGGTVRLLRAPRLPGFKPTDLSIGTWGPEREDFMTRWKVEAFVGFRAPRRLREGDVFYVRDGTRLSEEYEGRKVLPRDRARERHLLVTDWYAAREKARKEIKEQFFKLTASSLASSKRERQLLTRIVDENLRKM